MIARLLLFCTLTAAVWAQDRWWLTEPVSLIQTNLRQTDSGLDPNTLIKQIKEFPANTLLFSVGGITAHYTTSVEYHYRSALLPPGRDLVGDVVRLAHENNIRVIARFDFSRARKTVYDAHPEWFYKQKNGLPVFDDNDLYNVCINGGYYRQKAIEILTEALDRYEVDGMFFNWFGNLSFDYKRNPVGLCHCDQCEQRFKEKYGRPVPDAADKEYDEFIYQCAVEVARDFGELIHRKRPSALFMTYIEDYTDALVSESDFYKWRPLPQWIYCSSEHVNYALNARPDAAIFNLVMPYTEMPYRFASTPGPGLRAFLYESMANGAFPAFVVLGTMDQPDRTALNAVRPVFQFYDKHKDDYLAQENAARVILCPAPDRGSNDYRGFFRLLSELHIPFKVTSQIAALDPSDTDLVIIPSGTIPDELVSYMNSGGKVLIAGSTHPHPLFGKTVKQWENTTSSYMRITDHTIFPSLKDTDVLFWEGSYLELEPVPAPLTLIPPGPFGPPDMVDPLNESTNKPGLILKQIGKGQAGFIPWHIGDLYYRFSNDKYRLFVSDLVDYLLPNHQRQLTTNAHPSVEITVMRQEKQDRTLVHLTNLIGHSGTAFFDAVPMHNIELEIKGRFSKAQSLTSNQNLPVELVGDYTKFTLPTLNEFETIILHE